MILGGDCLDTVTSGGGATALGSGGGSTLPSSPVAQSRWSSAGCIIVLAKAPMGTKSDGRGER